MKGLLVLNRKEAHRARESQGGESQDLIHRPKGKTNHQTQDSARHHLPPNGETFEMVKGNFPEGAGGMAST